MRNLIIALTFIWSGLLIGISFMEAPLKFQAPNITTELGLGIGQIVFTALNRVEWAITILLGISFWMVRPERKIITLYAIPIAILLIQTVWLFPVLDERINIILSGGTVPEAPHHLIFIILEVIKLLSLLFVGSYFLRQLPSQSST